MAMPITNEVLLRSRAGVFGKASKDWGALSCKGRPFKSNSNISHLTEIDPFEQLYSEVRTAASAL